MNLLLKLTALLTLCLLGTTGLNALSIGREGAPFLQDDIEWQMVKYEHNDCGFVATLPGSPRSGIRNASVYTASTLNDTHYEVHTPFANLSAKPSLEDFVANVQRSLGEKASVNLLPSNQQAVIAIVEVIFHSESKLMRMYYCDKNIYYAYATGEELSLAPAFFESITIIK